MTRRRQSYADEYERPKPTLDQQLDGAGLFAAPAPSPAASVPLVRVSRRSLTQDRADVASQALGSGMRAEILAFLRERYPRGFTRQEIADALSTPTRRMLLQTVCGRVNDLLTWKRDGQLAPLVYEGETINGSARVYAYPALSHSSTTLP